MVDIRYLRSFMVVAEYLNFTKASEHLYISQSTLSKHIAELEEQLGVQLFIRNHHSVRLTPAGVTLFKESSALLAKISEVFEKTRKAQIEVWGTLKIGCSGIEHIFLPKILKRFTALYPHITLDIRLLSVTAITEALERQELDIGFIPFIGHELKTKFKQRKIRRARLCFLLPRNHPLANKYSLDFCDLKHERFILLNQSDNVHDFDWLIQQCHKKGFTPNIFNQYSRMESIFWQVAAGIGVSFWCFDPIYCQMLRNSISFVAMNGNDAYGNIAAFWKNENPNPVTSLFIKELDNIILSGKHPLRRTSIS